MNLADTFAFTITNTPYVTPRSILSATLNPIANTLDNLNIFTALVSSDLRLPGDLSMACARRCEGRMQDLTIRI